MWHRHSPSLFADASTVRPQVDYSRVMPSEMEQTTGAIETDDIIVLLLGAPGGPGPTGYLAGVTRLEKLVFLLEKETPARSWITELADFRSDKFGPFSAKIYKAARKPCGRTTCSRTRRCSPKNTEDRWEEVNIVGDELMPYTTLGLRVDGARPQVLRGSRQRASGGGRGDPHCVQGSLRGSAATPARAIRVRALSGLH